MSEHDERIARLEELLDVVSTLPASLRERIARYAEPAMHSDCILWSGPYSRQVSGGPRPELSLSGRKRRVARLVLESRMGRPLDSLFACHTCDVSMCINPQHLFAGTTTDNMRDMVAKGRHSSRMSPDSVLKEEQHPRARLANADVRAIRALLGESRSQSAIAAKFGVSQAHVSRIKLGLQRRSS